MIQIRTVISVTVIYVTFSSISLVVYMGKSKPDKQRAKHVYPVFTTPDIPILKAYPTPRVGGKFKKITKMTRNYKHKDTRSNASEN